LKIKDDEAMALCWDVFGDENEEENEFSIYRVKRR
jgi:hypothetical protein